MDLRKANLDTRQSSSSKRYGATAPQGSGAGSRVKLRDRVDNLKANIGTNREKLLTEKQNPSPVEELYIFETDLNPKSEHQSVQEKLDIVLSLLEKLIGTKLSFEEIEKLNETPTTKAGLVSSSELRADSLIKENPSSKIDTKEEAEFSAFKQDFNKKQLNELETRLDGTSSRSEKAKLRAEINSKNAAVEFWQEREEAWQEKDSHQIKVGDDSFSAFKVEFYRSQNTGLENLMDQWLTVNDDTGFARAQVAQVRSQINMVDSAEQFWRNENDFWREESKSQYKLEDQAKVIAIYKEIEKAASKYDSALLGENSDSGLELFSNLEKAKLSLNQYKTNPNGEYQGYIPYLGDTVNPAEEKAFSSFKVNFYDSQFTGLQNLEDQWSAVNDESGFAATQLKEVRAQKKLVLNAKEFWSEEEKFWDEIGKAGHSKENREEISNLVSQVTSLENLMDQWLLITGDESKMTFASGQVQKIQLELDSVKTKIKRLHSNF